MLCIIQNLVISDENKYKTLLANNVNGCPHLFPQPGTEPHIEVIWLSRKYCVRNYLCIYVIFRSETFKETKQQMK